MSGSRLLPHYEIRVEGVLGGGWACWFEGLQVSSEAGETIISGPVADQPALHGVLVKQPAAARLTRSGSSTLAESGP